MTIKSPYLVKEPDLLFCSESSTFRPITLDYGDADMLPAGTPISADGKVANDLTAVGLLAYDAYKGYKDKELIILTGHVILDKAQEHCGLVYTAEAKAALKSIIFVGDTELPAGGGGEPSWEWLTVVPTGEYSFEAVEETDGMYAAMLTPDEEAAIRFKPGCMIQIEWDGDVYRYPYERLEGNAFKLNNGALAMYGNTSLFLTGVSDGTPFVAGMGAAIDLFAEAPAKHTVGVSVYVPKEENSLRYYAYLTWENDSRILAKETPAGVEKCGALEFVNAYLDGRVTVYHSQKTYTIVEVNIVNMYSTGVEVTLLDINAAGAIETIKATTAPEVL